MMTRHALRAILMLMSRHTCCAFLILAAFIFSGLMPLAAQPYGSGYLSSDVMASLRGEEGLYASSSGNFTGLSLAPDHPLAKEMGDTIRAEDPSVVVEALFLWPKPHAAENEMLSVYNVLRAIGSLEGIEYYSASRKRMRLLYEYSSLVVGPDDLRPLADKRLEQIPSHSESLFARQEDTTFGDNRYSIVVTGSKEYVTQVSTNLDTIRLGILPVAAPGNIRLRMLVLSTDDAILFYAASSARAMIVPGIKATLETSFKNRVAAVYLWFSKQLSAAWPSIP